jgi:hypothetical protein
LRNHHSASQPADRRNKIWWVESQYLEVFEKTWEFINGYRTDWKTSEWHNIVRPEGVGRGEKGGQWKAACHNGRAMIE